MAIYNCKIQMPNWLVSSEQISKAVASPKIQAAAITALFGLGAGLVFGSPTALSVWSSGIITGFFWHRDITLIKENTPVLSKENPLLTVGDEIQMDPTKVSDSENQTTIEKKDPFEQVDPVLLAKLNEAARRGKESTRRAGEATDRMLKTWKRVRQEW